MGAPRQRESQLLLDFVPEILVVLGQRVCHFLRAPPRDEISDGDVVLVPQGAHLFDAFDGGAETPICVYKISLRQEAEMKRWLPGHRLEIEVLKTHRRKSGVKE